MKKSLILTGLITTLAFTAPSFAETVVSKTIIPPTTTTSVDPVTGQKTTTTTSSSSTYSRSTDTDPRVKSIRSPSQFSKYAYSRWDKNGDGYISADEWNSNVVEWYGPGVTSYKTYADWDRNHNGRLDENEFDRVMNDTDLYKSWNVVTKTEPAAGMTPDASFAAYDLDGNGSITPSEWAQTHK